MKSSLSDFRRLNSYSAGFYGVWIAHLGRKMGLFSGLATKPMTERELALSTGLYLPAVEAWCSAATAYGFIKRKAGGKHHLLKGMENMLIKAAHPDYLGGQISYLALRSLEYGAFHNLFKHGKATPLSRTMEAIEEATHWDHYAFLRTVKHHDTLHRLLAKGCNFADIGCGTGSLLSKICAEYPRSKYYGIDPSSEAVAAARKSLRGTPAVVLKAKGEDFRFADEFDIVYLGESLYAADNKRAFVANCHRSLKKGGTLLIVEGLLPESGLQQDEMLIMGMQIDFALQGNKFMTKDELKKLLKSAGFRALRFTTLGGSVYLISARK